jgi:DNA-directed RNA polymerase specialized sigma subunit, sigma24 homolog
MKFRKTPLKQRGTYKYYDENGKLIAKLIPGVDGVTELDILEYHRADDREVYNNIKNARPKMTDEEKQQYKDWEEQSDWRMFDKNWTVSIDALSEEGNSSDKSDIWVQVHNRQQEIDEVDPMIERLHEVVMMLTPEQQELYRLVYIEEIPQVQIAEKLGITKQALQSRLNKIKTKIKKIF